LEIDRLGGEAELRMITAGVATRELAEISARYKQGAGFDPNAMAARA
jgi:hypothetical protein